MNDSRISHGRASLSAAGEQPGTTSFSPSLEAQAQAANFDWCKHLLALLRPSLAPTRGPRVATIAHCGIVDYAAALDLQNRLVAARLADQVGDLLLLLEHPHVFTLGRGADDRFLLNPAELPVYRISRGGQVTYHGPGQLVGYPIMRLEGSERDVIRYLRKLEEVIIASLSVIGLEAGRRAGLTGVWIGTEKIASIGVGFRRWVSMHGFALNVTTDLSFFDMIVPCGIAGCRMTSVASQGLREVTIQSMVPIVAREFSRVFGYEPNLWAGALGESADSPAASARREDEPERG